MVSATESLYGTDAVLSVDPYLLWPKATIFSESPYRFCCRLYSPYKKMYLQYWAVLINLYCAVIKNFQGTGNHYKV